MAVNLQDAKITVKLDVEESKKELETVEKRTEDQRREEDRAEKREKARERRSRRGKTGVLAGAAAGVRGARGRLAGALATIVGIGALFELLAPSIAGFVAELLPESLKKMGLDKVIKDATNAAVAAFDDQVMTRITASLQAVDASKSLQRARILSGQPVTALGVLDDLHAEFRWSRSRAQADRAKDRLTRGFIGEALGKGVSDLWR